MQMATLLIVGFVMALVLSSNRKPQRPLPLWSQHWQGWQKIFSVVGFAAALLIVMNPEFLALGMLGDAAFFDLLVFALSLQFQTVVMHAARCTRDWSVRALSFVVLRFRRDLTMVAVTLAPLGDLALKIRKAVGRVWCVAWV
jgi:hypothetical protein